MGLGPLLSIYQARFNRYLRDRGLIQGPEVKVVSFIGDGETDEPETLGSLTLAARERLDNLLWVVNCNLQRLDGPVRGNGKIIQELEAVFSGAGWNVIKVIWGTDWDDLLARDTSGLLLKRMEEAVDGDYQKYSVEPGSYTRKHFFGKYPELLQLVNHLTDEQIRKLTRGGHDPLKVYAAYAAAFAHKGQPTVILAKTVKGYGLGEAGEGRNITHQQKKLNEKELLEFRARFGVPIPDEAIAEMPFYRPADDSPEMVYLQARRKALGGYLPRRVVSTESLAIPPRDYFSEFFKGSGQAAASTTMGFVCGCSRYCSATRPLANGSCPSFPMKRAPSGWTPCSARWASTRPKVSSTSRWTANRCSIISKRKTARFWRKASPRRGRPRRLWRRARLTPRMDCP